MREEPGDGAGRRAVIEVSDEGPGTAEGLRKEVFERFRQACGAGATVPGAVLVAVWRRDRLRWTPFSSP